MKIIKSYTSDVFQDNGCLHFDKARTVGLTQPVPSIGALRVICQQWQLPRDMELLFATCFLCSRAVWEDPQSPFSTYTPWIFIADAGWRNADRITRYKRLWRKLAERWDISEFDEQIEMEVSSSEGIRFVGLAKIGRSGIGTAFQLMREYSVAILLTPGKELRGEINMESIFKASFPLSKGIPGENLDLLGMSLFLCPLNVVVVRAGGSFGERQVATDFLVKAEDVSRTVTQGLWSNLEVDLQ